MAAPTPVTNLYKNGKAFVSSWRGVWAGTGDFTDTIIVNLSDLNYTNRIRILNIAITATTGISAELEFEGSTDALVYHHPIGIGETAYLDFTPIGGLIWDGQTDTGDIVLTTLSAASADVVSIVVTGRCS
jgi:hypothetical protein|tara:strand:+ start:1795 stop:2184 length:390 start_codon:yes stop_codon:yes gene_type:complete